MSPVPPWVPLRPRHTPHQGQDHGTIAVRSTARASNLGSPLFIELPTRVQQHAAGSVSPALRSLPKIYGEDRGSPCESGSVYCNSLHLRRRGLNKLHGISYRELCCFTCRLPLSPPISKKVKLRSKLAPFLATCLSTQVTLDFLRQPLSAPTRTAALDLLTERRVSRYI
jgi:hypothetical protein